MKKALFLILLSITFTFCSIPIASSEEPKAELFRPFYEGYEEGTKHFDGIGGEPWIPTLNDKGITREWNFEGWEIEQLIIVIRWAIPIWTGMYYTWDLFVPVSLDNGETWTHNFTIWGNIHTKPTGKWKGWDYVDQIYEVFPEQYWLFTPSTRLKFQIEMPWYGSDYLCLVYWGDGQEPVPPHDWIDGDDNYVQYYIQFYVTYTEKTIQYKRETVDFPYNKTKAKLQKSADMIINTMHPSGASNEVVGKIWGRETWLIIYSSQLAMMELLDLASIMDNETSSRYLLAVKRFINWMWSKQNQTDGSFPFILVDGDQHPWYGNPTNTTETFQVSANSDDASRYNYNDYDNFQIGPEPLGVGIFIWNPPTTKYWKYGAGLRFQGVNIPWGAEIISAKLRGYTSQADTMTTVNSKIRGQKSPNPITFSTLEDFDARPRTDTVVNWDDIAPWSADTWYYSPEIKDIVQEIIGQSEWACGNAMVLIWDDFDDRSTHVDDCYRSWDNHNENPTKAVKLEVTWAYPQWYGYDKIDSFSACAISLMKEYYDATEDLDFMNFFWAQIENSKDFIVDLMNTTYWLPVDGYHFNGTDYNKSEMNWLHDCVEAYSGIKDYAYLEGVRGNSSEQTYWNNYANNISNGIRTYFWNETLQRYTGMFYINNATQNVAMVYNIITPLIYGIETNETRGISTLSQYISWGILSGRYYDKKWAEDYSVFNEYSTMSGMIYSAFYRLMIDFNYTRMWMKMSFLEISKFLFLNPIYPERDLQNNNGWLDYVNLVNYTYATEYARLVEGSAWIINGFLKIANMTDLFIFSKAELATINQTLTTQRAFWEEKYDEFKNETGLTWNSNKVTLRTWEQWLKANGTYVQWYDHKFLEYLIEHDYLEPDIPWWEDDIPPDWIDVVIITSWNPLLAIMGLIGLLILIITPTYTVYEVKKKKNYMAIFYAFVLMAIGYAFLVGWLR